MQSTQPPSSDAVVNKRGRNAPRSKKGCWTCRTKKVKCDEERPSCGRCLRLRLGCDYAPRCKFKCSDGTVSLNQSTSVVVPSLPAQMNLPDLSTSASSVNLSSADHEAIRYFRTTFASMRHTKNPHYSMYAIIFGMAQREPMVMRAVLALGNRELESRLDNNVNNGGLAVVAEDDRTRKHSFSRVQHYSAALRLMADSLGGCDGDDDGGEAEENRQLDIDTIYATLFLMVVYERKYGDARCSGLSKHLAGAAVVLKHHFRFPLQVAITATDQTSKAALMPRGQDRNNGRSLSLFSARVLVYLATHDASASTFGLGGEINAALNQILPSQNPSGASSLAEGPAARLHRFSYPLYRTIWGDEYPQTELLDDVNNRDIFALATARAQLRFMVAQMGKLHGELARQKSLEVDAFIQDIRCRFGELLEVAGQLSIATDSSQRLVVNMRQIVPQYYAVLLEFGRVKRRLGLDDSPPSEDYMRNIMNLALQTFKHEGDESLVRIAWPLFVVGLETSDELHREWILARFQAMTRYGNNLQRACRFLVASIKAKALQPNPDVARIQFQSDDLELFVI